MLTVSVVYALPDRQFQAEIEVADESTVEDVLQSAAQLGAIPASVIETAPVAVWGRESARSARVSAGDRVELLRPLQHDPAERRRELARSGQAMGRTGAGKGDSR